MNPAVKATLKLIRSYDFRPVPLHHQSKAAVDKRFASIDYVPPGDAYWDGKKQYGVGCVTGPQYHGPVDADLDCPEAIEIAPLFFPATSAVFGRLSKLNSHRIYKVEESSFPSMRFSDPVDKSMILELRGDGEDGGMQTVFPGSFHEATGELVDWSGPDTDRIITVAKPDDLIIAAKNTAISVLIRRYLWLPGSRNEVSLALAGLFFKLEWTCDEALAVMQAAIGKDFDTKARYRVVHTFDRAARGATVAGSSRLYELFDKQLVDRIRAWAGTDDLNLIEEYNERFAVTMFGATHCVVDTKVPAGGILSFMQHKDFLLYRHTDYMAEPDDKGKPVRKAIKWLASPARRSYDDVEFMPGSEQGVQRGNQFLLNLWTGWAVEPEQGDCSGWLELLKDVICGGDPVLYRWMLHWFAQIVREPAKKSRTCPVMIGVEGSGKTLITTYFGRILGSGYFPVTQDKQLYGNFNKHIATALLLHSEEATKTSDDKNASILRAMITDEFAVLEPKNIDAKRVRSYMRVLISSNSPHPAQVQPGDRRFTMVDVENRKPSDDLITRVVAEMEGGGPAALMHYLMHELEYDPKIAYVNVKNDALLTTKLGGLDPYERWWLERLMEGEILDALLSGYKAPAEHPWPPQVSLSAMYGSCRFFLERNNLRRAFNEKQMRQRIERCAGVKFFEGRLAYNWDIENVDHDVSRHFLHLGPRQNSVKNMPSLQSCRDAMEKHMGQKIEWPDPGAPFVPKLVEPNKPKKPKY